MSMIKLFLIFLIFGFSHIVMPADIDHSLLKNNCRVSILQNNRVITPYSMAGGASWFRVSRNQFKISTPEPMCEPSIARLHSKNELAGVAVMPTVVTLSGYSFSLKAFTLGDVLDGFYVPTDLNRKLINARPLDYVDYCKSQSACPPLVMARRTKAPFINGEGESQGFAEFIYSKNDENEFTDGVRGYFLVVYTSFSSPSKTSEIELLKANPLVITFD